MFSELVKKNRSYRRFVESHEISKETLLELVELARLTPSGRNLQHLKYMLSYEPHLNDKIFSSLAWAGYLRDWDGPGQGERPAAYIVILGDTSVSSEVLFDPGIAGQTILLGAVEKGFGGCMLGNIKKVQLRKELGIPEQYEILLVIALGKPAEQVVIEPVGPGGDIKYWRDDQGVHHVPKRSLEELVIRPGVQ